MRKKLTIGAWAGMCAFAWSAHALLPLPDPAPYRADAGSSGNAVAKQAEQNLVGGIDFWKYDRLHIPAPATRNILPNPSFEQGFRFWYWAESKFTEEKCHEIVPEGLFGRNALFVRHTKDSAEGMASFPIALDSGKTYTLSVYAKSVLPRASMSLRIGSIARDGKFRGRYGVRHGDHANPESKFKITNEWKRYSRTFTADASGIRILFGCSGDLYLDGMQLEEGSEPTEFTLPPIEGNFVTAKPDNDIFKGEKIGGAFEFQGNPGTKGTVHVSVVNAYRETLCEHDLNVEIGADGFARMELPLDPEGIGEGIFVVKAEYRTGDLNWIQYYRFNVMSPLMNTHATKDVFGNLEGSSHFPCGENLARKTRDWGFGSTSWGYDGQDSVKARLEKKYGIRNYLHVVNNKHKKLKLGARLRKTTEVTDELVKEIEELAYNAAKEYDPEQAFSWALFNEEEGMPLASKGKYDEYFKLQHAVVRGVKRANPNALISPTHGTSGYSILRGYNSYEGYLTAALKQGYRYDAVGIHPYGAVDGATLGSLDLDHDIQMLIDQLKRHGYPDDTPIYLSELFNKPVVSVPDWDPKNWGNVCCGTLTYAFGNREFIQASSVARIWLTALKYWPKVRMTNVWINKPFLDMHLSPFLFCKAANTMGHLMPDVKFHSESKPSANIRAYVFERKGQKPIAAIWCIDCDVENGFKRGPEIEVKFDQSVSFVDLTGNLRTASPDADGVTRMRLTPAPLFIIADDVAKLSKALKELSSTDVKATLEFSINPAADGRLTAMLRNKTAAQKSGNVTIDGVTHEYSLSDSGVNAFDVMSGRKVVANVMYNTNPKVEIVPVRGDKLSVDWNMDYFYVPHVEGVPEWNKIASMKMTNRHPAQKSVRVGDHEAEWKTAWNEDGFYVRIEVKDDDFVDTSEKWKKVGAERSLWLHDGALEMYFDCGANGRIKSKPAYDDDDYRYDFAHRNGVGKVWRWKEVNQQLADGENMPSKEEASQKVVCDFEQTEDGYAYTIKFAQRYIEPIELKKGFKFGFALYLHDADKKKTHKALTTGMRAGSHCQSDPASWPIAILGGNE